MNAIRIASRRTSSAELHRVAAGDPRQIVGDLPHVIDAIDERLLRIAERRIAAAKETADERSTAARPPAGWCWRS